MINLISLLIAIFDRWIAENQMGYRGFVRMYEGLLYAPPPWARARVHAAGVHIYLKNHRTNWFVWRLPIVSSRYRLMYQFSYVKISSTDQNANVVLLDDPGRVRSQITSGLCPKTLVLCTGFVYRVYLKKSSLRVESWAL